MLVFQSIDLDVTIIAQLNFFEGSKMLFFKLSGNIGRCTTCSAEDVEDTTLRNTGLNMNRNILICSEVKKDVLKIKKLEYGLKEMSLNLGKQSNVHTNQELML